MHDGFKVLEVPSEILDLGVVEDCGVFRGLISPESAIDARLGRLRPRLLNVVSRPHIHNDVFRIRQRPGHVEGGRQRHEEGFSYPDINLDIVPAPSDHTHRTVGEGGMRTLNPRRHPILDRRQTLAELGLRGAQLLEGGGEVFELVVEALLDGAELLGGEGREVDCEVGVSRVDEEDERGYPFGGGFLPWWRRVCGGGEGGRVRCGLGGNGFGVHGEGARGRGLANWLGCSRQLGLVLRGWVDDRVN